MSVQLDLDTARLLRWLAFVGYGQVQDEDSRVVVEQYAQAVKALDVAIAIAVHQQVKGA